MDSHGISLESVKGMPLRVRAMRFMRAKGEGVADMRVRGSVGAGMVEFVGRVGVGEVGV